MQPQQPPNAGPPPGQPANPANATGVDPAAEGAPAEDQMQGQPVGGQNLEPGEEFASPEEEAAMEKAIEAVFHYIYKSKHDKITERLDDPKTPTFRIIAQIGTEILRNMIGGAKQEKMELDQDFWMELATVIIEQLEEVAQAMGLQLSEDDGEKALYEMVSYLGMDMEGDTASQAAAAEQLALMGQDPAYQQAALELEARADSDPGPQGGEGGMEMPQKTGVAQAVQQGVGGMQ